MLGNGYDVGSAGLVIEPRGRLLRCMSPPRRLDISKLFFKLPRKSATGNQSLTGKFQNDLRRLCVPGYATIMVNGIRAHASFKPD
jgi:hypothetical protein